MDDERCDVPSTSMSASETTNGTLAAYCAGFQCQSMAAGGHALKQFAECHINSEIARCPAAKQATGVIIVSKYRKSSCQRHMSINYKATMFQFLRVGRNFFLRWSAHPFSPCTKSNSVLREHCKHNFRPSSKRCLSVWSMVNGCKP